MSDRPAGRDLGGEPDDGGPMIPIKPPDPPMVAYRAALRRYDGPRLVEVHASTGGADLGGKADRLPDFIADRLAESRAADRLVAALGPGPRAALGLMALAETTSTPLEGLMLGLRCLGVDPVDSVARLAETGLVAISPRDPFARVVDYVRAIGPKGKHVDVLAHPSSLNAARTILPDPGEVGPLPEVDQVRQVREADGLEPILRLAAAWQRIDAGAIRQTQQKSFFKRDRERLEDDPVLAGVITDAIEPLPDMPLLWVALARAVGLVEDEPGTDRLVAADPEFWADNAVHLPQMIATRWLAMKNWHELAGMVEEGGAGVGPGVGVGGESVELGLPSLRAPALLWLATLPEAAWVAVGDLADRFDALCPGWDRPTAEELTPFPSPGGAETLASILLGPAYQLGLVRAAEESSEARRRVVQLTPLGRYTLAVGPPPPPRAAFDHFLLAQPNFEMIAYRQGLTPTSIGQFSRFARWSKVGSALELKLTPDSVYRGLEGGLTTDRMLDRLTRHSARPLPAGVAEAIRTWADRRDRVTYHASTTLVEFASTDDLERALALWADNPTKAPPTRISGRILLVEDDAGIPFSRFRMVGSRDYRRPPEACVEVEGDGVTLALDLGRSDLLVDSELSRFADERPPVDPDRPLDDDRPGASARRWFEVSPRSLARAAEDGLTIGQMARWFEQRTGEPVPAAVRLLLHAATPRVAPFAADRPVVMTVPTLELLDGLVQHPATGPLLGHRLGPTSVVVPDESVGPLRIALGSLGLGLGAIGEAVDLSPPPEPPAEPPEPDPAEAPAPSPRPGRGRPKGSRTRRA